MTETSSSFLLVRRPLVLARLRREISDILGEDVTLNRSHIQKLQWLKCVLNESECIHEPVSPQA